MFGLKEYSKGLLSGDASCESIHSKGRDVDYQEKIANG
jgi:hypothetical protein